MYFLNLLNAFDSYLFGLIQSDGNFKEQSRNRGRVSIELSKRDEDIIIKIQNIIGGKIFYRKRNTNFKKITNLSV